jgi:hypothetical protein
MERYLAAADVSVTIALVDSAGNAFTPSSASYRVLDEEGATLVDLRSVPYLDPNGGPLGILIGADLNVLPVGAVRALRVVEVVAKTDAGTRLVTHSYVIEANEPLVLGVNSFQTITKAEFVAMDIPNLPGWAAADRAARAAAMIQARENLGQLRYRYRFDDNWMNYVMPEFALYSITTLTPEEYLGLPAPFRRNLERAQVIEADDLLNADPVLEKRRAGIVSETVGDSTTSFNAVRPNRGLVCPRAMQEMTRYVLRRTRLSRV